ncbi:Zinc finger C2H2-type [Pacmanvirus A23]|uniref:Zinc finger C2H2-type n=1 Tax=Pacmanvirus A23 TaxID=1932881 RepID=UPI000A094BAB|nr:Zinc finger C2H2-type [Pacmanvirus A23]SIP86148.1 Zinc finger C2H2-type [Pacmanvirus A23]
MAANDKFKCYNCGKSFADNKDLNRHKNRKTPCLIREVEPEQINNPNRCIFCNKIFTNIGNRNKHLKICKVKNGGMDILVDKVKYDQEIRILKERMEQKDKEMEQKDKEKEEQIKKLMEEVDALKKAITVPQVAQTINNVNNITNNNTINITINNYMKPNINNLTITADEISSADKLPKLLLQKMYFNPELPENHCMYLQNKKEKSLILYDNGKWKSVTGENTKDVIRDLGNIIAGDEGFKLINGKQGPYNGSDSIFEKLPLPCINKIVGYNTLNEQKILSQDDAYEVFLGGRDVVLGTIRAAGCKLV